MSDFEKEVLGVLKNIQQDVQSLQQDVRRVEVILESHEEKFDQIIEAVSPEIQKNNEQNVRIEDHENRILKLESA